jgi:hypothetical protein
VLEARKAPLQQYCFPPQEIDAREGDEVYDAQGEKVGTVDAVNLAARTIDIKKLGRCADDHPHTVFFHKQVNSDPLRKSLVRLGRRCSRAVCDADLGRSDRAVAATIARGQPDVDSQAARRLNGHGLQLQRRNETIGCGVRTPVHSMATCWRSRARRAPARLTRAHT